MKFVFDTNVYFQLLHDPSVLQRSESLIATVAPRLFLSSVVRFELLQGARGELGRARVRRATTTLERVGRVVTPLHSDWDRAGNVQGRIWDDHPNLRKQALENDILIACSAARIGAIIVTNNVSDFRLIRRYLSHKSMTLEELDSSLRA